MKPFLIITILSFVGVQNVWGRTDLMDKVDGGFGPKDKFYAQECGQELKMDAYLYNENLFGYFYGVTGFKSKKLTCFLACHSRKSAESQGLTLHEAYLASINTVKKFNVDIPKELIDEFKSKGEYCYAKEQDECEYYACLEITKPPFTKFFGLIAKKYLAGMSPFFHKN